MNKDQEQRLKEIEQAVENFDQQGAVALLTDTVKRWPNFQQGHLLFSQAMQELGHTALALDSARKAVALNKVDPKAMLQLSRCYYAGGLLEQSLQAAQAAENILKDSHDGMLLTSLGAHYFHLDKFDEAIALHKRAVELDGKEVLFWLNLASTTQAAGDLSEAEKLFYKVLELDPDNSKAYANLARIKKQTKESNHVKEIETLMVKLKDNKEDLMNLSYGLAKEYEDLQEYKKSFAFLEAGSNIRRQSLKYDIRWDTSFFQKLIRSFPEDIFNNESRGCDSEEPIFVVGMPRSGTTLTEQIISSHSDVFAAGELKDFNMNLSIQSNIKKPLVAFSEDDFRSLLSSDAALMGRRYIAKTRPRTGHTQHFTDKMPSNSFLCGFIHWSLPKAKIVLLDRHPVDVCFSNYKLMFNKAYEYSYTQPELAEYYLAWKRLMDHWEKIIPKENFYRISYEKLVANQEEESRKLIEFCGLGWQDQCLQFHKNKEGVKTASLAQVRQPIYKTAVARWRHYEPYLQPLIQRLESAGIDCS